MLPVFCMVDCAILYCAGCPFFIRLAARSSTVLPPYTTDGADAARLFYGWWRDPLLCYPSNTTVGADAARFLYTVGGAILYGATPPYTTVGADATRFFVRSAA